MIAGQDDAEQHREDGQQARVAGHGGERGALASLTPVSSAKVDGR